MTADGTLGSDAVDGMMETDAVDESAGDRAMASLPVNRRENLGEECESGARRKKICC